MLNILYSTALKNKPLVDLAILVFGFILRMLYGGIIIGVVISNWMYLTVMSGAFFFAFGKRRNEMRQKNNTRAVLESYNSDFLDKGTYVSMALTNVFYSLWSIEVPNKYVIWTVPLVYIICLKYCMDLESADEDGNPVDILLKDKSLIIMCTVYAAVMIMALYVPKF